MDNDISGHAYCAQCTFYDGYDLFLLSLIEWAQTQLEQSNAPLEWSNTPLEWSHSPLEWSNTLFEWSNGPLEYLMARQSV